MAGSREDATDLLALLGTALELVFAGLIGLALLALAWAGNVSFDFTPEKIHTLSDQAKRTARRLTDDAGTVFYNSQEQGRSGR